MADFLGGGFVLSEDLCFEAQGGGIITLSGDVKCLGGINLRVDKTLEIVDGEGATARVQTIRYSYNAHIVRGHNILRFDSPHLTHNKFHHVHRFDTLGTGELTALQKLESEDDRPTLSEVLLEVQSWYWENIEKLPG